MLITPHRHDTFTKPVAFLNSKSAGEQKNIFLMILSYDCHKKKARSFVVNYDSTSAELQELGKSILLMVF